MRLLSLVLLVALSSCVLCACSSGPATPPLDMVLQEACDQAVYGECGGHGVWVVDDEFVVSSSGYGPGCADYGFVELERLSDGDVLCYDRLFVYGSVRECEDESHRELFDSLDITQDDLGLDPAEHAVERIDC